VRLTFRGKLLLIVGATTVAFVALIVGSTVITMREDRRLVELERRLLPKLELGPQLESDFEGLRRGFMDAVAAQDAEALDKNREVLGRLLNRLAAARDAVDPTAAASLRTAIEDYHHTAHDISRRMIAGETGETVTEAIAAMQGKHGRTAVALKQATSLDRNQLNAAFADASRDRHTADRLRLYISIGCLGFVLVLSLWLSRGVLRSLQELSVGLGRFGRGDFAQPVPERGGDELGTVAVSANRMAANLRTLAAERDRREWLTQGQAKLARELRGELEPAEIGTRAVRFLAGYANAPAAALYVADESGDLALLAHYGLGGDAAVPGLFRRAEGLVGQAALQEELLVVNDPPADFLRVRSGLGQGPPRALVLVPLAHNGRVRGVLELALFQPASEALREFLTSVQEAVAIGLEVAQARAAMRTLLAETQRLAERLTAQEEEVRANNEELQAQGEELRQANDELENQRRALERQNAALEEARQRLEQKAGELVTVSMYKSRFLANMSHELRTPLNSMLILSNLLAENEGRNLTDKQVEYCKTINSAGRDLLALINQVLDLSKIESGKQELRLEVVPLWELTEHARRMFDPLATDKGLGLAVELEEGLPETITTDRQRLEQVLTNLLGNAIKFTSSGQVALRVRGPRPETRLPRGLTAATAVAFEVSDTGVGIAIADQERVFAPFEQVEARTDRRYGGTGLGLAIARELAALLGGELQLDSTPGVGSTFTCLIPRVMAERAGPPAPDPARTREDARPSAGNGGEAPAFPRAAAPPRRVADDREALKPGQPHLLVIEDDPVVAEQLVDLIRARGLKAVVASRGQEGLRLARDGRPRGIILDVRLPDLDGWTVMELLREDPETRAIPVHFLTAVDNPERAFALGAIGYLTKPVDRGALSEAVRRVAVPGGERPTSILVVEDDRERGQSLARLLQGEGLAAQHVTSAAGAMAALQAERFGCLILDLGLPDMDGLGLLDALAARPEIEMPPVVVHTGRALSREEIQRLEAYAQAVVLKEGRSTDRLLEEIRLFVQHLKPGSGAVAGTAVAGSGTASDVRLDGSKLLVADDDMRTVYALSALLRTKGAQVIMADNGRTALELLEQHPDVQAVLVDVMMPEMDGYEAMRRIRQQSRFHQLPIIALTAKAMKGERERCLEAGASDYMAKPVDGDRLLALLAASLGGARRHDHRTAG
jgi:CheY-like chemotaxis protein/signal transduction histidine kinase